MNKTDTRTLKKNHRLESVMQEAGNASRRIQNIRPS